jgi:elongation factor Ts
VPKDKPAPIIEKIIDGKMGKFYSGACLLEQAFIKNPDQTINQLLAEKSKALGDKITIRRFLRYMVGEAITA